MEARGPEKFNSDFELALLTAQIGPTVSPICISTEQEPY